MKFDETATVVSQNEISDGIYDMWIDTGNIAANAVPGQFISVYTKDASKLLPRPISICETDGSRLRIVYRIAGKGTKEFSGSGNDRYYRRIVHRQSLYKIYHRNNHGK